MRHNEKLFLLSIAIAAATCLDLAAAFGSRPSPVAEGDQLMLNVSVTDKAGRAVVGLSKQDFSILIDKSPADILHFGVDDTPESVAFLVDLSGSMQDSRSLLTAAERQLSQFPTSSSPGSEFLVIGFNERVSVVSDWTSDRDGFSQAVMGLGKVVPKGTTALYDACLLAINRSAQMSNRRKFILLLTDGQDDNSKTGYNHLRQALQNSCMTLYGIGIVDPRDPLAGYGRSILEELSSTSGGAAFFPSGPVQLAEAIAAVSLRMRQSYQIGLSKSPLPADGKYHKIVVKVGQASGGKSPYAVAAPQGFWAK